MVAASFEPNVTELFKSWRKNKRQIHMTIIHLNRFHRRALAKDSRLSEIALDNIWAKLMLILWTSLAEVEFNILLTEHYHFTKAFLTYTNINRKSATDKWLALVDYFFRDKYFRNQQRKLDEMNLGSTNYQRYFKLRQIIQEDLGPFIELRNRIAHGQWAVTFNYTGFEKNQELTTHAWKLSKKQIMLLKAFITNLPPLIRALITSRATFERDYDKYVNRIVKAKHDADMKFEWILTQRKQLLR